MAGKARAAGKAAATVAGGGGPADPVTDAIALKDVAKGAGKSGADGGGAPAATTEAVKDGGQAAGRAAKKKPGTVRRSARWAWSDNRRLLVGEFVVCVVVLGAGTLVAPSDSKHDVPRAMIKGSALAATFFILALVASGGRGPARVANAIGTLITASYVLTSADVHHIASWMANFFKAPKDLGAGGAGEADGQVAPSAGGTSTIGVTDGTSVIGVTEA